MYIYIDSDKNQDVFPENRNNDFRIKLPKELRLQGKWEVALIEVDLPKITNDYDPKYFILCTPACTENAFNDSLKPILRRVYRDQIRQNKHIHYEKPIYVPIIVDSLDIFHLYIRDDQNEPPSFQNGPSYCVLHLRQCPA